MSTQRSNAIADGIGRRLEALIGAPDERDRLAEASLTLARAQYPDLDVPAYLDRLQELGAGAAARLAGEAGGPERLELLNDYLFEEQGFEGNHEDFHNPRNSYLNDVLDHRRGIPITLAVVYIEVGRRLNMRLDGISFPGHFLVRYETPAGLMVIDPYHGGVTLDHDDLRERLTTIYGQRAENGEISIEPLLRAAGLGEIVVRMLRNLKGVYAHHGEWSRALEWANLILRMRPEDPEELRDRGVILQELGCARAALLDYESYLGARPGASDETQIRERLDRALAEQARLH